MVTRTSTRATKQAARKETIVDTPFVETVKPSAAQPDEQQAFTAYFESLIAGLPSWKRALCGAVLSTLGGLAASYLGGTLITYLVVGAVVLGAPMFIAQLLYVLGWIIVLYASYRTSGFVYLKVIDKTVDAKFAQAKGWVTGLFTTSGVAA